MNESIKRRINRLGLAGRIFSWVSIALLFIGFGFGSWILLLFGLRDGAYFSYQYTIMYDVELLLNGIAEQSSTALVLGKVFRLNAIPVIVSCIAVILISLDGLSAELRRCDTPFSDAVMRRLNGYAWTRFVCTTILFVTMLASRLLNTWPISAAGITASAGSIAAWIIFSLALRLPNTWPISAAGITASAAGIAVSILFSVIVLLLVRSFRHGAQLQPEERVKAKAKRTGLVMQIITIAMVLLIGISCVASILYETSYAEVTLTISDQAMGRNPLPLWISIISSGLLCVLGIVACVFQMRVASGYRNGTPFAEDTLRRTNRFAKVLLLCTGAAAVVKIIFSILSKPYHIMDNIYNVTTGNIFGALYSAVLILVPFFAGLIMLFLTKVFRRGAQLQTEGDETL